MSYTLLKHIHIASVTISYLLFFLRGVWMLRDASSLQQAWVRIVPHIVDTVLLASAIMLSVSIQQYPFSDAWLSVKLVSLLLYIALGMVALRLGNTRSLRVTAWIAAQCVFFYIVLVALTKQPTLGIC